MKTIILCGGFGTRISEFSNLIPKPMIEVGSKPILYHIMNTYARHGFKDFVLALGYKADVIKEYFLNFHLKSGDFRINFKTGEHTLLENEATPDWNVSLVDTGLNTMTGGRIKRLKKYIGNEPFMLTYGDGLANVNITELLKFHKNHKKMITVTAVSPVPRFGVMNIDHETNLVQSFSEKAQADVGLINGGFFVMNPEVFDLIEGDETFLEKEPLQKAAALSEMVAFHHSGFWQCMDTKRDYDHLNALARDCKPEPWYA